MRQRINRDSHYRLCLFFSFPSLCQFLQHAKHCSPTICPSIFQCFSNVSLVPRWAKISSQQGYTSYQFNAYCRHNSSASLCFNRLPTTCFTNEGDSAYKCIRKDTKSTCNCQNNTPCYEPTSYCYDALFPNLQFLQPLCTQASNAPQTCHRPSNQTPLLCCKEYFQCSCKHVIRLCFPFCPF